LNNVLIFSPSKFIVLFVESASSSKLPIVHPEKDPQQSKEINFPSNEVSKYAVNVPDIVKMKMKRVDSHSTGERLQLTMRKTFRHVIIGFVTFLALTIPAMSRIDESGLPSSMNAAAEMCDGVCNALNLNERRASFNQYQRDFLLEGLKKTALFFGDFGTGVSDKIYGGLHLLVIVIEQEIIFRVILQRSLVWVLGSMFQSGKIELQPVRSVPNKIAFAVTGLMNAFLTNYRCGDLHTNPKERLCALYFTLFYAHFAGTILGPNFYEKGVLTSILLHLLWSFGLLGISKCAGIVSRYF